MEILTDLDFKRKNTAVCIGKFDGIHRGHRRLLEKAKEDGLALLMITFLFPEHKGIYSIEEKQFLADKLGVDIFVSIPVTEEFMKMSPETFIEEILVERCGARHIVVGADFHFGYRRRGTAELLQRAGERYGFCVSVMEKLKEDGEVISSTRIRSLLGKGEMEQANRLLQTPYFIMGKVEKGNQIGRKMDVPTANITPSVQKELPPFGVYAARALVDGRVYDGVCNLGVKPTIPGNNKTGLEIWLFDFDGSLYEKEMVVSLYSYQRPERAFSGIDELKEQILSDTRQAKQILTLYD